MSDSLTEAKQRLRLIAELENNKSRLTEEEYNASLVILTGVSGGSRTSDSLMLAQALEKQTRSMQMPWSSTQTQYEANFQGYEKEAANTDEVSRQRLVDEMKAMAENGSLGPVEVMSLMYLLCLEDEDEAARSGITPNWPAKKCMRMLALLLLRTPYNTRFLTHNWGAIAPQMQPGDLMSNGSKMEHLHYPLFPPRSCMTTNNKIFAAFIPPPKNVAPMVYGGEAGSSEPRNDLSKFYNGDFIEELDVLQGGGVPLSSRQLRRKVDALSKENSSLQNEVVRLTEELRSLRAGTAFSPNYGRNNRNNGFNQGRNHNNNNNNNNNNRNNNYSNYSGPNS